MRYRISSSKLMEGNDVSVQLYSFLEVTAVRYGGNPDKSGKDMIFVIS